MGTITRNIFLFFPFVLTAISLGLLITVVLSQHTKSMLSDLYFLRINTNNLNLNVNVDNVNIGASILKTLGIPAYYSISLTNFCTGSALNNAPNYCSDPKAAYYFDPLQVWNVEQSQLRTLVPNEWEKSLNVYKQASKFMFAAYVVAIVATVLTLLFGIASFFLSRITSILTWLCADIAALFTVGASVAATAIYTVLAGVVNGKLHDEGVTTTFGTKLLVITWIAAASSIAAGLLWSCGICCGHSKHNDAKRSRSVNGRSAYERVPSPYKHDGHHDEGFSQPMPMYGQPQHQWPGQHAQQTPNTGYEPYRQV